MVNNTSERYVQIIRHNNFMVRDHTVFQVNALPGVALLDIVCRLWQQKKKSKKVHLKNINFYEPIVTSEDFDKNVYVQFESSDSCWNITVTSKKVKHGVELEDTIYKNMECRLLEHGDQFGKSQIAIEEFINHADYYWDMDRVYDMARRIDICHYEFMKTEGTIYQKNDRELMELHLSPLAKKYHSKFFAHPAFLDGATFAGGSFRFHIDQLDMVKDPDTYIPFAIEEFIIYQELPDKVYIYSEKPKYFNEDFNGFADILKNNIQIYTAQGDIVAEYKGFSAKRIRDSESIRRLLINNESNRTEEVKVTSCRSTESVENKKSRQSSIERIRHFIHRLCAGHVNSIGKEIDIKSGFYDLGLSSVHLLQVVKEMEEILDLTLYPTLLFEYSTIESLADYINDNYLDFFEISQRVVNSVPKEQKEEGSDEKCELIYLEPFWKQEGYGEKRMIDKQLTIILCEQEEKINETPEQLVIHLKNEEFDCINRALEKCNIAIQDFIKKYRGSSELLIQIAGERKCNKFLSAMGSMLKSVQLEMSGLCVQIIGVERITSEVFDLLVKESTYVQSGVWEIQYDQYYFRSCKYLREIEGNMTCEPAIKEGGVYLFTGGAGGLGKDLIKRLVCHFKIKPAIIGRRNVNNIDPDLIEHLKAEDVDYIYLQGDVSREKDTQYFLQEVKTKLGKINGVFHCAGTIEDSFYCDKKIESMLRVIASKVNGIINLDQNLGNESIDFFVSYSSFSAITGNLGQADYSFANAFLNEYSLERNEEVQRGKKYGRTYSINWPLWDQGGMQGKVNPKETGLSMFPLDLGYEAVLQLLRQPQVVTIPLYGDKEKIKAVLGKALSSTELQKKDNYIKSDIAIIGLSGKYPLTDNIEEFEEILRNGKDCIGKIPEERWKNLDFPYELRELYEHGGYIKDIEYFDPLFFNISPRQAELMDPQARLFLQSAWQACEDAGITVSEENHYRADSIGVFAGVFWNHYELVASDMTQKGIPISMGNSSGTIANLVSYCMNLHGPSVTIDTLCSSSLTAIHMACCSLHQQECGYAIAGGVNIMTHPHKLMFLKQANFLSPDGKCRSFGAGGNGYVPGEGVGSVVLTSVQNAEEKGYHIYGVIKSSAVNHMGKTSGFMAPDPAAQGEVIADAIEKSGIDPESIGYIEAHGTGTSLGDPIELRGLQTAFEKYTNKKQFCRIGSVKSNIGHTEAASGIAALMKVLLQFKNKEIYQSLHSETLNENLNFVDSPFLIADKRMEWSTLGSRCAGISSFGANGSNVHMIVKEYKYKCDEENEPEDVQMFIPLSAKNSEDLKKMVQHLYQYITDHSYLKIRDISYTLIYGRKKFRYGIGFTAKTTKELCIQLKNYEDNTGDYKIPSSDDFLMQESISKWLDLGKTDFEWQFANRAYSYVTLPGYPLKKERFWVADRMLPQVELKENSIYEERWRGQELTEVRVGGNRTGLIVFLESDKQKELFCSVCNQNGLEEDQIIFVVYANQFKKVTEQYFQVRKKEVADIQRLFETISTDATKIKSVIYMDDINIDKIVHSQDYESVFQFLKGIVLYAPKGLDIMLGGVYQTEAKRCFLESWISFGKSLSGTLQGTKIRSVIIEESQNSLSVAVQVLLREFMYGKDDALYNNSGRNIISIEKCTLTEHSYAFEKNQTFFITGGLGGLGFMVAQYLSQYCVNIILAGRSQLTEVAEIKINELRASGSQVFYEQLNINRYDQLDQILNTYRARFGKIDGVIHCAGVESKKRFLDSEFEEFKKILEPKIEGSMYLEKILKLEPSFICFFSSMLGITGDFGNCNYSIANRFQSVFASAKQGSKINTNIFAINWPLWREGGMAVGTDSDAEGYLLSTGQSYLGKQEGMLLFRKLISSHIHSGIVFSGEEKDAERLFKNERSACEREQKDHTNLDASLYAEICTDIKQQIGEVLNIKPSELDIYASLSEFGFDSVTLSEFSTKLSSHYTIGITPGLFYGFNTIEKLAKHFIQEYGAQMVKFYDLGSDTSNLSESGNLETIYPDDHDPLMKTHDIAIVGMSGKFPDADNVEEFWNNLKNGYSSIKMINGERWKDNGVEFQASLMRNVDHFDPLFFELSPLEAQNIDPQQRIFLMESWHALEDAGYMGGRIKGKRCGVFVGAEESQYGYGETLEGIMTGNLNATLPARIAYKLDLKGPNMCITTACASGLTAVHQACQSLRAEECEIALAGGISVLASPARHHALAAANMLSKNGTCNVFSNDADGMIPGEAAVVFVLKTLEKAKKDKDRIYGVIKASGINYDGSTNGITSPDPFSQYQLVSDTYKRGGIHAKDIQYILSHSTGSKVPDSIELDALAKVFKDSSHQNLQISSIKPLIGHTFAASGAVNLVAMLMSMKYGEKLGTKLSAEFNQYVDLDSLPFTVHAENQIWPNLLKKPRLGAVSATGVSGSNVHVVVEEYQQTEMENSAIVVPLLLLSAENEYCLNIYTHNLLQYLSKEVPLNLPSMFYTSQVGREELRFRVAFWGDTREQLITEIQNYISGNDGTYVSGKVDSKVREEAMLLIDIQKQSEPAEIAADWVKGRRIDWLNTYKEHPVIIEFPKYPFQQKSCWLITEERNMDETSSSKIILSNVSSINGFEVKINIGGNAKFLKEHVVQDKYILSGAAQLEFIRQVANIYFGRIDDKEQSISIKNVIWGTPISATEGNLCFSIKIREDMPNSHLFELYEGNNSGSTGMEKLCSSGHVEIARNRENDFALLIDSGKQMGRFSKEECYNFYHAMGIHYGDGHQCIKEILIQSVDGELRQQIEFLSEIEQDNKQFFIDPIILDSALHGCVGYSLYMDKDSSSLALPFAVDEVYFLKKADLYKRAIVCQTKKEEMVDIYVLDSHNHICIVLRGISSRVVNGSQQSEDREMSYLEEDILRFIGELLDIDPAIIDRKTDWAELGIDPYQFSTIECHIQQLPYLTTELNLQQTRNMDELLNCIKNSVWGFGGANKAIKQSIGNDSLVRPEMLEFIKKIISDTLMIPVNELEEDIAFPKYGIDSFMIMKITVELEKVFGSLSKTLFFEYQNLDELTEYFCKEYGSYFNKTNYLGSIADEVEKCSENKKIPTTDIGGEAFIVKPNELIAVIGMAGKFPGAEDISEYWVNLEEGRCTVSNLQEQQWPNSGYQLEGQENLCGGFLTETERFDPLFFEISPKEAMVMDPQEYVFLENVYNMLEDAGYINEVFSKKDRNKIGVFVGAMYEEYQLYGVEEMIKGRDLALTGNPSAIANRTSYYFDFQGPSMTVDTACSSSLTAVHLACESIKNGQCEMAVAGGVNLSLHPNKYQMLTQGNFISTRGRCFSFGKDGDGYVPGEAVGSILLKPLSKAIQDKDYIYGVIKGSALNHGGRANGYTVPNPNAQAQVIIDALKQAEVEPETISYIEAHGTGTALGDPIEITGLIKAFKQYTSKTAFCAVGSVKSNIGHCESAAGISGLIKVLMQMKHQKLVPTIFGEEINPNISFDNSPFYIQRTKQDWDTEMHQEISGRRAGISAFGAGGSNAHLIVEEYIRIKEDTVLNVEEQQLMLFSADSEQQLCEVLSRMKVYLNDNEQISLSDFAYSLQIGKKAMKYRVAIIAAGVTECIGYIETYLKHRDNILAPVFEPHIFVQKVRKKEIQKITEEKIRSMYEQNRLAEIAAYWITGAEINWKKINSGNKISLPQYPFDKIDCSYVKLFSNNGEQINKHHSDIETFIQQFLRTELLIPEHQIDMERSLFDYGMNSISLMKFVSGLNEVLGMSVQMNDLIQTESLYVVLTKLEKEQHSGKKGEEVEGQEELRLLEKFQRGEIGLDEIERRLGKEI